MKTMKKACSLILALLMLLPLSTAVFAQEDLPAPALTALDTSAIDGKLDAYVGVETYFVVYPEPLEAEDQFDIRNAVITCSDDSILTAEAEKIEEYRFGSVIINGLKTGSAVVTVTDPASGVSCSVTVTVKPVIGYRIRTFFEFLEYLPFFFFMRILQIFNR